MKKTALFTNILTILLGIVLSLGITPAYAVDGTPPGLFELDGDPVDSPGPGDDWDTLYNGGGNATQFTGILADPAPQSIYWKGGSKDILDIPNWWHKDGAVIDKGDITNAFAAAYLSPEDVCYNPAGTYDPECDDAGTVFVHFKNDLIIYFGLDRFDNNGDTFSGFWFLQDTVVKNDATSQFDGAHVAKTPTEPGDLLVLVEYPQGSNSSPLIKIYEWDPDDADGDGNLDETSKSLGPLDLIFGSDDALCDGNGNKLACAITNINNIAGPDWPYTPKDGGTDLPFETFYSGGINVTQLLGGTTPCISSFLAETRSSRSETAQLKDFVLGSFDLCGIAATKACEATLNSAGDKVTVLFAGEITNTGAIAVDISLSDSVSSSLITKVCFDDNGTSGECDAGDSLPANLAGLNTATATFTLEPGETALYEGDYVLNSPISSLNFTDTITAVAKVDGTQVDSAQATAKCSETGTPAVKATKFCTPSFENGDTFKAVITGGAENTGNVKLINMTLSDTVFSSAQLTVVTDSNKNGKVDAGEPVFDGDLIPGEKLAYTATFTSKSVTSHFNTMTVRGENVFDPGNAAGQFDNDSASTLAAACSIAPSPNIKVTKVCDTSINGTGVQLVQLGGVVSVEVGNVITVENTGNEILDPVQVSDSETKLTTTATGWSCTVGVCTGPLGLTGKITFTQTYNPDGANIIGALTNPGSVFFKNTATAQGKGVLSKTLVGPKTADAECKICPPCPDCL